MLRITKCAVTAVVAITLRRVAFMSFFFCFTASGNTSLPVNVTSADQIIGSNDLIKVKVDGSNVDANLRPYLNAFGLISVNTGTCTGTHIGNGYVLTAGHCLLADGETGSISHRDCSDFKIFWADRGSPEVGSPSPMITFTSQCTEIVYAERSPQRDFGIFKVDQAPSASLPISAVNRAGVGANLTIFSYPQGRPLEWSQYCPLVVLPSKPSQFSYQCDTEPGSSGAAILAIDEAGHPIIVGIHDSAISDEDYNRATQFADAAAAVKAKLGIDITQATQGSLRMFARF